MISSCISTAPAQKRVQPSCLFLHAPLFYALYPVIFASAHENNCSTGFYDTNRKTVIIDAGHGEPDGGAVGTDGVIEKNINLAVSLKLKNLFLAAGYNVILTRADDNAIYDKESKTIRQKKISDLQNRLSIINSHQDAILLSIHQNISKSGSANGSLVLFSRNNENSKELAQKIQSSIVALLQPQNKKMAAPADKKLYIMKYAKSLAVIVECGFLSNQVECKLLQDGAYQSKIAFAIYCGTLEFSSSN